jgi:N utilization substance protein A
VSLEEAQTMVMTARVLLGWVDPTELDPTEPEAVGEAEDGTDSDLADPEAAGS